MMNRVSASTKKIFFYLCFSIPVLCVFTVYCYRYLDRSIALAIYKIFPFTRADIIPFTHFVRHVTNFAYLGFVIIFIIFYFIQKIFGFRTKLCIFLKELFINIITSYCIIHFLKYVLGRVSVRNGSNYKMEVIADYSRYGFHMFSNHSSFPSGHITLITTAMVTLLFFYPKFRTGCIGIIILSSALVLYLDLHYLSDIIAGLYLGITIPFCTHILIKKNK